LNRFAIFAARFFAKMNTRKRTLDQTMELLIEHMAETNRHFESLLVQNKKICSLLSEMSESIYDIEQAVAPAKQPIINLLPTAAAATAAEDSNSMPPPLPHLPFPDEKLNGV